MTDMVVLAFDGEDTADMVRERLIELNTQYMLDLKEGVEVVRSADGKVKIKDEPRLTGLGAFGGAFWGFFIGILFLVPAFGMIVGAATGAIAGHFSTVGISQDFLKDTEDAIQPGQSALFILADDVKADRVIPLLQEYHPKVIRTSLTADQEAQLKQAFSSQ